MTSTVFFIDLRAKYTLNVFAKLERLLQRAGLPEILHARDLAAVKLHFGERGNAAYIRPVFLRKIVEDIKNQGAEPFLTDTNTLYSGTRSHAPGHIITAIQNGFAPSVVDAPIVIADGLRGKSDTAVDIDRKGVQRVYIGSEIVQADALISVAHFKGHELAGFGGAIKNLGMGCASRRGKLFQHADLSPKVKAKRCIGCGECVAHCSRKAISLCQEKARIDPETCIGCGECIIICANQAVKVRWNKSIPIFMEKMAAYTRGAVKGKKGKLLCVNFILDVSPGCDCLPYNDAPIVRDIGILASSDPVAIDQASVDLVNQEPGVRGSCLGENLAPGLDKFTAIYPEVDWSLLLDYAEKAGIGSRRYTLEKV